MICLGVPEKASEAGAADTGVVVGTSAGQVVAVERSSWDWSSSSQKFWTVAKLQRRQNRSSIFPRLTCVVVLGNQINVGADDCYRNVFAWSCLVQQFRQTSA